MIRAPRWIALFLALALVATLAAGCSRDPEVRKQKYYESGMRHFEQEKYREAAIQFLNAIQADARFVQAHYQLAQCYLRLGVWSGAYQELLRTVDIDPNHLKAQVDLGNLLLASRQLDRAEEKAKFILEKDPNNVDGHILMANSLAAQRNMAASLKEMETAIQLDPQRPRSFLNLAFLQVGAQQAAAAEANFKKAIELDPKSLEGLLSLGGFYQQQRRWAEAEPLFRRGVEAQPKNPLPRRALSLLFLAQGQREKAEQILQQAKLDLRDVPEGYRMLGDFYFGFNEIDKALAEYGSLYQEHPNDLRVKKNYVQLLILKGRLDEATSLNDEILKKTPKDVDGMSYRGQILLRRGQHSEAVPVLEAAVKADSDNAALHHYLGVAYAGVGNVNRAENEWREAVRLRPQLVPAQQALAQVAATKGDYELLAKIAEEVITASPMAPEGYLLRATSRFGKKDPAGAETDLKKAMELAPQNPDSYERLGSLRLSQKRYPEAEKLFEQALELNPATVGAMQGLVAMFSIQKQNPKALARVSAQIVKAPKSSPFQFLLGGLLINEKRWGEAEAALEKAVELDRNNLDALFLLGQLHATRGSNDKAAASYERALQQNPRDIRFYMLLGSLEEGRGNWQRAQQLYEKALQIQPDYPLAANNLAYILLEHGGNVDVALSLAQVARRGLPDLPQVADTLGWAYYQKNAFSLAVGLFEEASKKLPTEPTYHFHLGLAYQKLGDPVRARTHLRRALELDSKFKADEIRKALAEIGD
jgi:tetratricopeptide (TPR) repeat protein